MRIDTLVVSKLMVRAIVALIVMTGITIVLSNIYAPYTTQSQIQMPAINIHPQVSGNVTQVYVLNGQFVNKGDRLYSIDKREFNIQLDAAKAKLVSAQTELNSLHAQLLMDQSSLEQQKAIFQKSLKHFERFRRLFSVKQVSAEDYDQAKSDKESDYFAVQQKKAEIEQTKSQIGLPGQNPKVMQAESELASARLQLERTDVISGGSGVVSNLQINHGDFVSSTNNTMVVVDNQQQYLTANFNEKGLATLAINSQVSVVFDAYPGHIYQGLIVSIDKAIQGGVGQTGQLTQMTDSDRWIRKSEQFPVRIEMLNPPNNLIAGSKATVMATGDNGTFWGYFSKLIMQLMATLRYAY